MSAIGSTFHRYWPEIAWVCFCAANVIVIFLLGEWETIPFHFVWVSLALIYGIRRWSLRSTVVVVTIVSLVTGVALLVAVTQAEHGPGLDELAEVPLMAAMVVAMVWHVRRRQDAIEQVRILAESEHRLLESQRGFVRGASHELRTPITVARGHAELIRRTAADPQVREDIDVVLDELGHLSRLSERLLLLAALDQPGILSVGQVPIRPLVLDMARRWSPTSSRRWNVSVATDGYLMADEERVRIALDALVENAVKYTSEGDKIEIRATPDDDLVVFEVSDSGVGIDPGSIDRIFERSAYEGRPRDPGGTGLGLAIVKAIVDAHGGSVDVESAPGSGSTFRIKLPRYRRGRARTYDPGHPPSLDPAPGAPTSPSRPT
jgi:signal transduction histidine kinase